MDDDRQLAREQSQGLSAAASALLAEPIRQVVA